MRGVKLHLFAPPVRLPLATLAVAGSLACLAVSLVHCKDQAKESAAHAAPDAAMVATLVTKDVGEIERGLPEGATKLAPLVADGADPRQDIAGVRKALARVRRDVVDLNIAKSTFFALTDPAGVGIRNDLEEDRMAGQNLATGFPVLVKAKDGFVTGTGAFPGTEKSGPDEDWIACSPVKRADGTTGAILVTGWSYRYFSRHLQEALKSQLLDQAKAAGQEGKIPVFYVSVFDKTGVFSSPVTPDVNTKALAGLDLVGKTAGGPVTGTIDIADRPFGYAAVRTPKLAPDTGVVVLRSDDD
jgi:hypothetical protein